MYIIIGLGNPEEEYAKTRHNMGFDAINKIAQNYHISVEKKKFEAIYTEAVIEGEKVILVKPQTYMNLSGTSVRQFAQFYKIPMENLIVIYDDMDIEKGTIKIRKKGGPRKSQWNEVCGERNGNQYISKSSNRNRNTGV